MLKSSALHKPRTVSICALLLLCYAAHVQADCHVSKDGYDYDLSGLDGRRDVEQTRETPPTTMKDLLIFNPCGPLPWQEDVPEHDQCPRGTAACLTTVNTKSTDPSPDRIVSVIPVGQNPSEPTITTFKAPLKGLQMQWQGAAYPNEDSKRQTFTLKLLCEPGTQAGPEFKSYDGETAVVEWKHELACPYKPGEEPSHEPPSESVGSSLGWFFLVLIIALAAYFGLGAYYNYATYGATGYDLIPHRDFWREVPYMLQDVVSHLCSSFRPRHSSSRGGYISV